MDGGTRGTEEIQRPLWTRLQPKRDDDRTILIKRSAVVSTHGPQHLYSCISEDPMFLQIVSKNNYIFITSIDTT